MSATKTDPIRQQVLARRVYRIGVEEVSVDDHGRYYASIRNRTYFSEHEIPKEAALRRLEHMRR